MHLTVNSLAALYSCCSLLAIPMLPGLCSVTLLNTNWMYRCCSSDGAAIVVSSLLGSSPCTVFVESASGIREGMSPIFATLSSCRSTRTAAACCHALRSTLQHLMCSTRALSALA